MSIANYQKRYINEYSSITNIKMAESRYDQRGVSSLKPEVHSAIAKLDQGIFPEAFCKILPDYLAMDPKFCCIQHSDGAGTKSGLAYLIWKNHGSLKSWANIIRDSLFMNLDDVGCVGALGPFLVNLTINRNKALIPGEIIKLLIEECQAICDFLTHYDIPCIFSGGETADVGDLVRTIVLDNTITVRMKRKDVIDAGRITHPALIVGFSSTGQAVWESFPNSGIGSNGMTNARHELLSSSYRKDTETYAPETNPDLIYCGDYALADYLPGDLRFTIGGALTSPTRTYLPLIYKLLSSIPRKHILGLIHCSGGGQTKIGKFGQLGITYLKYNLFPIPPLFELLHKARNLPPREMYQTYNMGHRLEVIVTSQTIADDCIAVAKECSIDARVVGEVVESNENQNMRQVVIETKLGREFYSFS
ncbi:MAG: phosphoribosylformylglycinamidine cyclo-ligase [Candidatus Portnoybacteria bacterium]|nr:phosphoribosylformylglycinamidine cyclo-ligase [Candidatus Portnoybacteria bacterium]